MKTKLITALIVLLGITLPASADTFTEGGINYRTLSDNTVAVTTGTYTGTVNVPQTVNHGGKSYTITEIGDSAFFKCADVTSVAIPVAVTRLGKRAFANSGITEVTIPVNVTDIDERCFSACKSLKTMNYNATNCKFTNYSTYSHFADCDIPTINIGNEVQILPHGLFNAYTGTEVTIPAGITEFYRNTFYGSNNITKIIFNATRCKDFTSEAFSSTTKKNVTEFIIGEGVVKIPDYLLSGMTTISTIKLPSTLKEIGKYSFSECSGMTSIAFNSSLTTIGNYAFTKSGLTSVTIPESITSIGNKAFSYCTSLSNVVFNAANCASPTSENATWFYRSPVLNITFGSKVTTIPGYIAYENTNITSFDVPEGITSIGANAFNGSGLTSITIPRGVTSIGKNAFSNCQSLTDVYFNAENCANPGSGINPVFNGSNITRFVIGDNVHNIPSHLLYRVKTLTEITIPENVTSMGINPFGYCENLREVTYNATRCVPNPPITNSLHAWFGDVHLFKLHIGENVEIIPEYLAYNQDSITEYNIPESVKEIGRYAFYSCMHLKKIELPRNIEKIDDYAFYNNKDMAGDVFIPASLTSMGKYIISSCENIGNIIVEAPVASPTHAYTFGDDIHRHSWLIVPRCSAQSYKAATGWSNFKHMINDVNGDDEIDISDVNKDLNTILYGGDDETIKAADVNGSSLVDISDANVIISFLLKK